MYWLSLAGLNLELGVSVRIFGHWLSLLPMGGKCLWIQTFSKIDDHISHIYLKTGKHQDTSIRNPFVWP